MEILHPICCGLDVHTKTVVACLIVNGKKTTRTFGTMTEELLELSDWLLEAGCPIVAMESTGVYLVFEQFRQRAAAVNHWNPKTPGFSGTFSERCPRGQGPRNS